MKRLLSTMWWDIQMQIRQGFYAATIFVTVVWVVILNFFPDEMVAFVLPAFLLQGLTINTYWFVAGLVLLEKVDGTLEAQVVTPLRASEYIASKISTLAFLSLAEAFLIALLSLWGGFNPAPLILGITIAAMIATLTGFVLVSRYDSISTFLMPGGFFTLVFILPFIYYFGLWESPLFYLHPFQAPMVLVKAAVAPIAAWEWVYGIGYGLLWVLITFSLAVRAFEKFVVRSEGVKG